MRKETTIPDFATEKEEIEFWDTHRIQDYSMGPADDIIIETRPQRKQRISLRIEPRLVVDLRELAHEHDTRYQTLARGLVKRGVRELERV